MLTPEIKITFRRHIRYIHRNPTLFAQLPYLCRVGGRVNCSEDHGVLVRQVGGFKVFIFVDELGGGQGGETVEDFGVEVETGGDESYFCVSFEDVG